MGFRDREKQRVTGLKEQLFSADACGPGMYKQKARPFCLDEGASRQNLHEGIREDALRYFTLRSIRWHDGIVQQDAGECPSNHLLCSQTACVNAWFPFAHDGDALAGVLCELGYAADEVLPMDADAAAGDPLVPRVSFEWVGQRNYLGELHLGRTAADAGRTRGRNFTSADFAFRFRSGTGTHLVLGEWKYTEHYAAGQSKRYGTGRGRTDRLNIYRDFCTAGDGAIRLPPGVGAEDLLFDPFDQLMRLQLLAREMERAGELGATTVSVMHVAPRANAELMRRVTSPGLAMLGGDLHEIWGKLVPGGRFRGCAAEDLFPILVRHAPDVPGWGPYMSLRYGGMRCATQFTT